MLCVKRICRLLNLNSENMFTNEGLKKISSYLTKIATTKSVATAGIYQAHLASYRKFYGRYKSDLEISLKDIKKMATRLYRVGRAKNPKLPRKSIKLQDLQSIKNGSLLKQAEAILESTEVKGLKLKPKQAVICRDALFIKILFSNLCRNGELVNLTVDEFNEAEEIQGRYVILIHTHKSSWCYGPSHMVVDSTLYQQMAQYLRLRPDTRTPVKEFFLNVKGKKCSTDSVCHALNREYKLQTNSTRRIRTTDIRMLGTTIVHSTRGPNERHLLARKLMHSIVTAEKSYKSATTSQEALKGYDLISQVFEMK